MWLPDFGRPPRLGAIVTAFLVGTWVAWPPGGWWLLSCALPKEQSLAPRPAEAMAKFL